MSKVIVVNEKDEVLGYKDRDDRNTQDIIRVAGIWIFNRNKEVLIAQRSLSKIHDPGKWGPSVAGTVEEGETYTSNIIKEVEEELGIIIQDSDLVIGPKSLRATSHKYFSQAFFTEYDAPISDFITAQDEVEQIKWIHIEELVALVKQKPEDFLASFEFSLENVKDFLNDRFKN